VLPLSEQAKVVYSMVSKFIGKKTGLWKKDPYMPDFKRGIHHFCIHAGTLSGLLLYMGFQCFMSGGRGVIDGVEKNLNLSPEHVAASRYALYT
jgi:3-ketoacyl-CoA synthase